MSDIVKTDTVVAIQGIPVSSTPPTLGQILRFDGTQWAPATVVIPFVSPVDIFGLQLWLRADLGITLSGSEVIEWDDQSGVGDSNRNMTQSAGSTCPTFNAIDSSFNNQPTLSFDQASSQCLFSSVWSPYITQPYTIIVVGSASPVGTTTQGFCGGVSNTTSPILYNDRATGDWTIYDGIGGFVHGPTAVDNVSIVFYAEYNTINSTIRISQETVNDTATLDVSPSCGQYGFQIGNDAYNHFLNGTVAEVLVYNSILSPADRANLQNYLGIRYNIGIAS